MSYGVSEPDLLRRSGTYMILKGAKPTDMRGAANDVRVIDRSKNGEEIGITNPAHVLARADRVIK